jgi:predicted nucleic acid-binding protein
MVAALAQAMDLTLLTTDLDFKALPDLHVENWLG